VRRFRYSALVCHFKLNLAHYPPVLGNVRTGQTALVASVLLAVTSLLRSRRRFEEALPHGHPAAEQRCPLSTAKLLPLPQVSARTRQRECATKVLCTAHIPNAPARCEPACAASTPRRCRRVEGAAGVLLGMGMHCARPGVYKNASVLASSPHSTFEPPSALLPPAFASSPLLHPPRP
jgi:hypothetical protein